MLLIDDSLAVITHMNEDHSDAVLVYAQVYGNLPTAESARMVAMSSQYMELEVDSGDSREGLRIHFDSPVKDRTESRIKLVELLKLARAGNPPTLKIETITTS